MPSYTRIAWIIAVSFILAFICAMVPEKQGLLIANTILGTAFITVFILTVG